MVSLYSPLVDRWSQRAGLQDADIADVRQEVFLAVSRKIGEFHRDREGDTFRGWLHRIAQNKLRDRWRSKRGQPIQEGERDFDEIAASSDGDAATVREETRLLYGRALELIKLNFEEKRWRAFWRVVVDGEPPRDVAQELQMTVNAVYLAKGRVLARLREEFAGLIDN